MIIFALFRIFARSGLDRIYNCINDLEFAAKNAQSGKELTDREKEYKNTIDKLKDKYIAAMDDDLNTADAISAIFEIVSEANKSAAAADSGFSKETIEYTVSVIRELGGVLGLLQKGGNEIPENVKALLEERKAARAAKDWAKSDALRDELRDMGYIVKDTAQGQQLTKA